MSVVVLKHNELGTQLVLITLNSRTTCELWVPWENGHPCQRPLRYGSARGAQAALDRYGMGSRVELRAVQP